MKSWIYLFVAAIYLACSSLLAVSQHSAREINYEILPSVYDALGPNGGQIFMRHGEQMMTDRVAKIESSSTQKIAMMRYPDNENNPITRDSKRELIRLTEFVVDLEALLNGAKSYEDRVLFRVETSANMRASIVARSLATILNAGIESKKVWNCINYPAESVMKTEDLKKHLSKGNLPWEKDKVDGLLGKGTFDAMTESVVAELEQPLPEKTIRIVVTHTQQLNIVAEKLGLKAGRLANYGMIVVPRDKTKKPFVLEQGVFKKS